MKKEPTRIVAPAEYQIPDTFAHEVGNIIVRWAYLEQAVRRVAWDLLGVNPKIGRIAVRDPRLDDYLDMIVDLAYLKKIPLNTADISSLKTKVNEVAQWRDLLGHGIWIPNNGQWLIQRTSGNYPKSYSAEHRKRRINPEGVNVDADGLNSISEAIGILINEVLTIRASLALTSLIVPDLAR